jgi:hypothetical protein
VRAPDVLLVSGGPQLAQLQEVAAATSSEYGSLICSTAMHYTTCSPQPGVGDVLLVSGGPQLAQLQEVAAATSSEYWVSF